MGSLLTAVLYVAACAGLVVLPVSETGYERYHAPKELLLAACALLGVVATWRRKIPLDVASTAVLLALPAMAASAALATSPELSMRGMALAACAAGLFLAARGATEHEASAVRGAIVIAATGIAAVAILESLGVVTGLSGPGRAPGSTIGQRNGVAHTLAIVCPAAWTMAARSPTRGERILGAIGAAVLVAGIVVTRSRAAWLVLPVALVVWLIRSEHRRRALIPLAAAAVFALALPTALQWSSPTPYVETATRLFDASSGSGAGRLVQYRATLELVAQHPLLGVGPGNWMVEYPTVSPPGDPTFRTHGWLHTGRLANSDWVGLLAEGGLLGAAVALAFVLGIARKGSRDAETLAVLVAALGVGALDAVLQTPTPAAYAAMLLGLGLRAPAAEQRSLPLLLRAALALAIAAALVFSARRLLAVKERTWPQPTYAGSEAALDWYPYYLQARFSLAESYTQAGACTRAKPHLDMLRKLLPNHQQPRQLAATCRLTE